MNRSKKKEKKVWKIEAYKAGLRQDALMSSSVDEFAATWRLFSDVIKTTLMVGDDLKFCKLHGYLVIQSIYRSMTPQMWGWSLLRFLE